MCEVITAGQRRPGRRRSERKLCCLGKARADSDGENEDDGINLNTHKQTRSPRSVSSSSWPRRGGLGGRRSSADGFSRSSRRLGSSWWPGEAGCQKKGLGRLERMMSQPDRLLFVLSAWGKVVVLKITPVGQFVVGGKNRFWSR